MIDQVHNESLKLVANWLNAASIAIVGGGAILPVIAFLYGGVDAEIPEPSLVVLCFTFGLALHCSGQFVIGGLQSE